MCDFPPAIFLELGQPRSKAKIDVSQGFEYKTSLTV